MADIDADGDLDLMYTNERHAKVYFYRNTGTAVRPQFVNETGTDTDPFKDVTLDSTYTYRYAKLAFLDADSDGDLDLVSSDTGGRFY